MLFYDLGSQALLYVLLNVRCGVVTEEQAVLSRFFFSQTHAHMCPRIAQDGCIPPCVAWQKIMLSSAKKRCEIRGPCGQAATP